MAIDISQNYFVQFALPEKFEIDVQALSESFRKLQQVVHPDKFAMAGDQERRIAMQQASYLNQAYQTLKDPLQRARYLLRLRFGESPETETLHDLEFLEQQMHLREILSDAKESENIEGLSELSATIENEINVLRQQINTCFEQTGEQEKTIAKFIDRWQFLEKLSEEVQQAEERILGL